jgi:DNA polymerase-3 subunit delta'
MFDGIRGQAAAIEVLRRALAGGRVAHAYAFVGPSGVGRRLAARAFARALLCPAGGHQAVEACPACRKVQAGTHPDFMVLTPTPPESNPRGNPAIRIEAVRALERRAALAPAEAAWKVFLVEEAGRMTPETPQAVLKTLEEPPPRTVIVLILQETRELPATVLSRCQVVRFRPLAEEDAAAVLEGRGVEPATARLLARASRGRPGVALAGDPATWTARREQALAALAEVETGGAEALLRLGEGRDREREEVERLIEAWWLWERDLLCVKAGAAPRVLVHPDRGADLGRAAAARSWEEIEAGLAACREAWQALRGNVSPRLTLEVALARLALRAA